MNHSVGFAPPAAATATPPEDGLTIWVSSGASKLSVSAESPGLPNGDIGARLSGEGPKTTGGREPAEGLGAATAGAAGLPSENIESRAWPISSSRPAPGGSVFSATGGPGSSTGGALPSPAPPPAP